MILSEEESKRYLAELFDLFARHLVATVLRVSHIDSKHPAGRVIFPGFLLVCKGRWFYVTAGHNLARALDEGLRVENAAFVDTFGPEAVSQYPVPFPFGDLPKYHVDIESKIGLDLGLIEFTPYYQPNLLPLFERNKVIPLEEEHWTGQDLSVFESFYVLGFPDNLHGSSFVYGPKAVLKPTLIPLEWIADPDEGITQGRKGLFCARYSEKLEVSIEGASGGPIFGLKRRPDLQYQIVAMQFSQRRDKRIAIGCAMPLIGYVLSRWIEKAEEGL
ncbi:MAG: hypothetical protein ABSG38_12795 [Spirochaetia bacterium]